MSIGIFLGLGGTIVATRIVWHELKLVSVSDPLAWSGIALHR